MQLPRNPPMGVGHLLHRATNPWTRPVHVQQHGARQRRHHSTLAAVPVVADVFAAVAPICFDQECAANADQAFLTAVSLPVLAAVAAAAYVARPPPAELRESGEVFEDEATGVMFQAEPDEAEPERDKDGLLAFRPISYTPWPVPVDYEGERVRIDVGPIRDRKPRTYVFDKKLPQPSELVLVRLPRPMGVVFEWDQRRKRAFVVDVVEGSVAEQQRRKAKLNAALLKESVQDGDVLRAVTATNFVYETRALIGAVPPERHIVVFGADKQSWARIRGALRKGEAKDGSVTLILERRVAPALGSSRMPPPAVASSVRDSR